MSQRTEINNLSAKKVNQYSTSHLQYKCVILAAGASMRLRPLTDTKPKCLLEVGGKILLEETVKNVHKAGIKDIAIVIGYRGEMIREFIKMQFPQLRIRFIFNPNFSVTNNAYSLLLARRFLENKEGKVDSGLLLLDSDILFSSQLLPFVLNKPSSGRVAVRVSGEHNEEEISVKKDSDENITRIGKEIPLSDAFGESIGIEAFSAEIAVRLFNTLERRIRNGAGRTEFYEASFQEMVDNGVKLQAIDVSAFPAIEIDTLEDLRFAEQMSVD